MHQIRTISLDLDDTLWEIHPVIRRAEQRLYIWLGENRPRITEQFTPQALQSVRAEVIARSDGEAHDLSLIRRRVLEYIGNAAGYDNDFIDDAFAVFDTARNEVELFPEVLPALEALRTRYRLIALTNGNANLKKIGIDHLFDHFITAADAGAAKPAQPMFDAAVAAGGASAAETLHVGDHAELDIAGAHAAGLKTAWVNRNDQLWPDDIKRPHIEVMHIGELAEFLLQLPEDGTGTTF